MLHHEVFISYSHVDKPIADATCAKLESSGVRCWMAPRDVPAGMEYAEALLNAVECSRGLVLIFSSHANDSPHVKREVERAISKGKFVLPVRVEDVLPTGAMEYCLCNTHWLDALTPPLEQRIAELVDSVHVLISRPAKTTEALSQLKPYTAVAHRTNSVYRIAHLAGQLPIRARFVLAWNCTCRTSDLILANWMHHTMWEPLKYMRNVFLPESLGAIRTPNDCSQADYFSEALPRLNEILSEATRNSSHMRSSTIVLRSIGTAIQFADCVLTRGRGIEDLVQQFCGTYGMVNPDNSIVLRTVGDDISDLERSFREHSVPDDAMLHSDQLGKDELWPFGKPALFNPQVDQRKSFWGHLSDLFS
jgi:hypothetical protein